MTRGFAAILFCIFIFLLPWHALLVTYLKCKLGIDTTLLRFWKEIFVIVFVVIAWVFALRENHFKLSKIYKDNYILWVTTFFIISSIIYIVFPYQIVQFFSNTYIALQWWENNILADIRPSSILWFRYDVVFLFALIIWLLYTPIKKYTHWFLYSAFTSTFLILTIFWIWYLFFDISSTTEIFWFSDKVSTYKAFECLSFSQNVAGHHRFQATFGWPIRFSVFIVVIYVLFIGYILSTNYKKYIKISLISIASILVFSWVFFSYSKTSLLGLGFGIGLFIYITWRHLFRGKFSKKFITAISTIILIWVLWIWYIKRDLFLHPEAILNRLDNLAMSVEMFFYNPIGYGLWIAWPATQIWRSIESAGWWEISTAWPMAVSTFLPENWYVQILLEQWLLWLWLFIWILAVAGYLLFNIIKQKKDFYSVGIFSAFITLAFMWLFTHVYEEAATAYILFLLVGIHVSAFQYGKKQKN